MSNIIQLLEKMGNNASLQNQQQLASAIAQADIDAELKQALTEKNRDKLNAKIKNCPTIICSMVIRPDDLPDEQPNEQPEPEKTPEENKLMANA